MVKAEGNKLIYKHSFNLLSLHLLTSYLCLRAKLRGEHILPFLLGGCRKVTQKRMWIQGWRNATSYYREVGQREILGFLVPLFQLTTMVQNSAIKASRRKARISLSSFASVEGEHSSLRYPSIYEMYLFCIVGQSKTEPLKYLSLYRKSSK